MEENKIVIYQTDDGRTQIDVRLENDTVWLTQAQMAELFQKTPQNITMHIRNAYKEGELDENATCKEYLQVRMEGKRTVKRSSYGSSTTTAFFIVRTVRSVWPTTLWWP